MQTLLLAALPLLLVLAATFIYAGIAAGSNEYQIKSEANVSHLWETRERLAAVAGFAVLAYVWPVLQAAQPALAIGAPILAAGAAACLFGLRFDRRLNLRRGLSPHYVGTDPNTARADKQVRARGISGKQYALLKLAGVLLLGAGAVALLLAAQA